MKLIGAYYSVPIQTDKVYIIGTFPGIQKNMLNFLKNLCFV